MNTLTKEARRARHQAIRIMQSVGIFEKSRLINTGFANQRRGVEIAQRCRAVQNRRNPDPNESLYDFIEVE